MEVRNNGSPSDGQAGNEGQLARVGPTLSVCVAALSLSLSPSRRLEESQERAAEIFDVIATPPPPYSLPLPAPSPSSSSESEGPAHAQRERDGGSYVAGDGRQFPGEVLGKSKSNRYLFEAGAGEKVQQARLIVNYATSTASHSPFCIAPSLSLYLSVHLRYVSSTRPPPLPCRRRPATPRRPTAAALF